MPFRLLCWCMHVHVMHNWSPQNFGCFLGAVFNCREIDEKSTCERKTHVQAHLCQLTPPLQANHQFTDDRVVFFKLVMLLLKQTLQKWYCSCSMSTWGPRGVQSPKAIGLFFTVSWQVRKVAILWGKCDFLTRTGIMFWKLQMTYTHKYHRNIFWCIYIEGIRKLQWQCKIIFVSWCLLGWKWLSKRSSANWWSKNCITKEKSQAIFLALWKSTKHNRWIVRRVRKPAKEGLKGC